VSKERARDVLGGYDDHHTWSQGDFASALLVLDALGAPDQLVHDWRKAGSRAQREATLSRERAERAELLAPKREKRAKFWKYFRKGAPAIILVVVFCLGTGIAIAHLGTPPALGAGNWAALVITCLIFLAVAWSFAYVTWEDMWGIDWADMYLLIVCIVRHRESRPWFASESYRSDRSDSHYAPYSTGYSQLVHLAVLKLI
jgi:hypothetical protein